MKISFLTFFCATLLSLNAFAQAPTPPISPVTPPEPASATPAISPASTPAMPAVPAVTATAFPTATVAVTSASSPAATVSSKDPDDEIDQKIERRIKSKFNFTSKNHPTDNSEDMAWMAVPIVFIVFFAIFGMPVLIVAVILYFSFSKNRAMHKTVRMMVEKGQPVPESLLNPPPVVRQRSDLRRGIKWMLWGVGFMIFFGACTDWDGGAWSIGIIPFMIGIGYIIFWRLDLREDPTPLPIAQPPASPPSSPTV